MRRLGILVLALAGLAALLAGCGGGEGEEASTAEDVMTAVKNARLPQPAWQALPLKNRTKYVMKFAEYIQKHSTELAEIISKDNGKTVCDAMFREVAPAGLATGYYSTH